MQNIPTLDDEVASGYLGRLRRLNGDLPIERVRKLLCESFHNHAVRGERNWAILLASASGLDFEEFVRLHTFQPLLRTVHTRSAGIVHGTYASPFQLNSCIQLPGKWARFCVDCIQSDILSGRAIYWRRNHQFAGAAVCAAHNSVLFEANKITILNGTPLDAQRSAQPIAYEIVLAAQANPIIQRYIQICSAFLKIDRPISAHQAASCLAAKASNYGLRISAIGIKQNLSDLVVEKLAGPWLDQFLPGLSKKRPGEFVAKIDGPCISKHTSYHVSSYALALAVLWECPTDAVEEFMRPLTQDLRTKKSATPALESFVSSNIGPAPLPSNDSTEKKVVVLGRALGRFLSGCSLAQASEHYGLPVDALETILRNQLARDYA